MFQAARFQFPRTPFAFLRGPLVFGAGLSIVFIISMPCNVNLRVSGALALDCEAASPFDRYTGRVVEVNDRVDRKV
jgi:hypothetical protein